jgi:hypothetical protein
MTSEGLGEMFEGDLVEMCDDKLSLQWGDEQTCQVCPDEKRGRPSAQVEMCVLCLQCTPVQLFWLRLASRLGMWGWIFENI